MKALKIILSILLVLVLLAVIAMFVIPTKFNVERSIEINAPKAMVHRYVSHLQLMDEWGVWFEMDPEMENVYEGEDGKVGAINTWKSEVIGDGSQEITLLTADRVETKMKFTGDWESEADAYIQLTDGEAGAVKVSWGFNTVIGRPFNLLMVIMGFEKSMNDDYDSGLIKLKNLLEEKAASKNYNGYTIESVEVPPTTFLYNRANVSFDSIQDFFGTNLPDLYGKLMKGGAAPGSPSGLFFVWDMENSTADMAAAIPFSGGKPMNANDVMLLEGSALKVDYFGNYGDGQMPAYMGMDDYIKDFGLEERGIVWEEYVTDPGVEPDTSKWLTRIYYFLK